MLSNPRIGDAVICWYRNRKMPLHGLRGIVHVVSHGRPRNHGILIDGILYIIPCGNLRRITVGDSNG